MDAELGIDVFDVRLHGVNTHMTDLRYLSVREAPRDVLEHLSLALGERADAIGQCADLRYWLGRLRA